jgi:ribosomal protein L9
VRYIKAGKFTKVPRGYRKQYLADKAAAVAAAK